MELNDDCVRSFALGRVFKDKPDRINSIDFHRVHDLAVTAGDDDAIHLYDTLSGSRKKTCFSKKYGVSNAVFTHHTNAILYASTRGSDHALRYLSLHDNKYLRYFPGHRSRVRVQLMIPTRGHCYVCARLCICVHCFVQLRVHCSVYMCTV